jgi:hypothetical protein
MRPDGAGVVKVVEEDGRDDEDVEGGGIGWFVRFSPFSRLKKGGLQVQVRWGVLSCFWVLAGPWLPRSLWETVGGRCVSPAYPGPGVFYIPLSLGDVYGADVEESERGSPSVKWVSGSGMHGSFCLDFWGPLVLWHLWFLCWGTTGSRCVSMACP